MHLRLQTAALATVALLLTIAVHIAGQRDAQADVTARIVTSAQALVATLDDAGRAKVQFPFVGPQKTRWSNLPSPMFPRQGLRLADLTPPQRAAIKELLSVALSR